MTKCDQRTAIDVTLWTRTLAFFNSVQKCDIILTLFRSVTSESGGLLEAQRSARRARLAAASSASAACCTSHTDCCSAVRSPALVRAMTALYRADWRRYLQYLCYKAVQSCSLLNVGTTLTNSAR